MKASNRESHLQALTRWGQMFVATYNICFLTIIQFGNNNKKRGKKNKNEWELRRVLEKREAFNTIQITL